MIRSVRFSSEITRSTWEHYWAKEIVNYIETKRMSLLWLSGQLFVDCVFGSSIVSPKQRGHVQYNILNTFRLRQAFWLESRIELNRIRDGLSKKLDYILEKGILSLSSLFCFVLINQYDPSLLLVLLLS